MTGWENYILYSWNTSSNSNSIAHLPYIDLPMYLQEGRKKISVCAAWEHSQLPLKPLLSTWQVWNFDIPSQPLAGTRFQYSPSTPEYPVHCNWLYPTLSETSLTFLLFVFTIFQRAKWTCCIWNLQPVLSSAETIQRGFSCRQDTGPVLWDLCWPSPDARNNLRSQHTTANPSDTWSLIPGAITSLIKQHISSRAINFSFLWKANILCAQCSPVLYFTSRLVSHVSLQLGEFQWAMTQITGYHHTEPLC